MRKTAWLTQKGGVGKSAGTAGTAGALVERGRRVLVVDGDPQGHLTTEALGLDDSASGRLDNGGAAPNLANALTGDYSGPVRDLLVKHSTHDSGGELVVLPTSIDMFLVTRSLYSGARAMEWRLSRLLDDLHSELGPDERPDHVLIDCPPSLDVLTDNALVAADGLVIPVQPDRTSRRALRLLLTQITAMEQELRLSPRDLHGLMLSVFRRPLSDLDRYMVGELERMEEQDAGLAILAHFPLMVRVKEAWFSGQPLPLYAPRHELADQYRRVAVKLDVAAGLASPEEWQSLPALPRVADDAETEAVSA